METWLLVSTLFLWVIVLVNLMLTLALIRRLNRAAPAIESGPALGAKAPDFAAETLTGARSTLATYVGQDRTFLFIAPECQPCHELLQTLALEPDRTRGELVLVCNGSRQEALNLAHQFAIEIPLLLAPRADNPLFEAYKIRATPTYCSFDAQGIVRVKGIPGSNDPHWQKLIARWNRQATSGERREASTPLG